MADAPRVLEINDTEVNAETIAAKLGLPVDDAEVQRTLATLTLAVTNLHEEGTHLSLLVSMGRYLGHSVEACRDIMGELATLEDKAEREERAHHAIHHGIGLLLDFMAKLNAQLPCQRDENEMPSGCTKH